VPTLLIFLGMAAATFFTRYTMIAALGRDDLARGSTPSPSEDNAQGTPLLRRWLRYVPPAVLAALVVPPILAPQGHLEVDLPALALLAGAVVAWRTRSVLWTIVGGMAVFWILGALGL
jgi:branched-subunit amino acid transport protein